MNAQDQTHSLQHTLLGRMAWAGAHLAGVAGSGSLPSPKPAPLLGVVKGQLWKLDGAYVEIVNAESKLVHYRVVNQPGQKTFTRVLKREAFESYLKESGAILAA